MTALDANVQRLLAESVVTPERLRVLLFLHRQRSRSLSATALASELRLTVDVAEEALAMLCGRGLLSVSVGNDLRYAYQPATKELDATVGALEAAFVHAPEDVLAWVMKDAAHMFADAFRVRRGDR